MKKLSKNKFAKLFATFLGASTILTPIATLVSCEQLNKTPVTQEKPTPTPNPGEISDPSQTPKPIDGTLTTIEGTTITIQLVKENNIVKVEILGNIPSNKLTEIFTTLDKDTYKNKTISSNSKLNIKTKNQTLKIKISDLKELLKKLPIKIDNEETITIDKDANITSIKGNINLTDITQNVSNNDELTIAQFINKQIQEGTTQIKSDGLEIQSKETDKIQTNNLKKVTKKLSKTYITNTTSNGTQTVTLDKDANITSVTGNISLKDVTENNNEEETEIAKYIAKKLKENSDTNFDSSNLTINTFYKKTTGRGAPSRDSSQINPDYTYESTPITPKFLKETKLNALNKAVLNFKDGDISVPVEFKSTLTDYFDVNEFYKEIETGKLNILKESNITVKNDKANNIQVLLRDLQETITDGRFNITPYIKADQILELINNEKLTDTLVIGDMYITGNVKDLLPKLVGPNKIKETNGGVKFLNVKDFLCPGPNVTEYDGGKNNIEPLPIDQLLEFRRRTDILEDEVLNKYTRSTRIQNLVLNNIDTTTMSQANLELLNFERNSVGGNITFKNSNLSKMQYKGTTGPVDLTFDNTTLPTSMESVTTRALVLKNATLAEELKTLSLKKIIKRLPFVNESLKIYNLQNNFLDKWTKEEIEQFEGKQYGPKEFVGPRSMWDKFLYLKETEFGTPTKFIEDNTTGSIQKQQSQLLALLKTQNKSRG